MKTNTTPSSPPNPTFMIMKTTIGYLSKAILPIIPMSLAVLFSGCTAVIHDMQVTGDYADFNATLKATAPISSNMSRVIIYYPRLPLAGVNLVPAELRWIAGRRGGPFVQYELKNAGYSFRHRGMDQAAVYLDVVPGNYTFQEDISKKQITITAQQGKTHFIKIRANSGLLNFDPPVVVEQRQALAEFEKSKMRGNLNYPLLCMVPNVPNVMTESPSMPASGVPAGSGRLYVFWVAGRPVGSIPLKLGLDSQTGYNLGNNKYCCIIAPAGRHALTSAIRAPFFSEDVYQLGHLVEVKQNQDTFVMYYSKKFLNEYQLRYLTPEEGRTFLKKYEQNNNGFLLKK